MTQLPLFVYGTLRPGGAAYETYLGGRVVAQEAALLRRAALYTDGRYPYLVTAADLAWEEMPVAGVLLALDAAGYVETLALMDEYEEVVTASQASLYERVVVEVERAGALARAWAYVAGPGPLAEIRAGRFARIPGGRWEAGGAGVSPAAL